MDDDTRCEMYVSYVLNQGCFLGRGSFEVLSKLLVCSVKLVGFELVFITVCSPKNRVDDWSVDRSIILE